MKLILFNAEYWFKEDTLPLNFNSMTDYEKWGYINEKNLLHREDGPAINYPNYKAWFLNGTYHNVRGPAIITPKKEIWYLNGSRIVDENKIHKLKEAYKKIQSSTKEDLLVYMIQNEYKDFLPLIEYELNKD